MSLSFIPIWDAGKAQILVKTMGVRAVGVGRQAASKRSLFPSPARSPKASSRGRFLCRGTLRSTRTDSTVQRFAALKTDRRREGELQACRRLHRRRSATISSLFLSASISSKALDIAFGKRVFESFSLLAEKIVGEHADDMREVERCCLAESDVHCSTGTGRYRFRF